MPRESMAEISDNLSERANEFTDIAIDVRAEILARFLPTIEKESIAQVLRANLDSLPEELLNQQYAFPELISLIEGPLEWSADGVDQRYEALYDFADELPEIQQDTLATLARDPHNKNLLIKDSIVNIRAAFLWLEQIEGPHDESEYAKKLVAEMIGFLCTQAGIPVPRILTARYSKEEQMDDRDRRMMANSLADTFQTNDEVRLKRERKIEGLKQELPVLFKYIGVLPSIIRQSIEKTE